VHWVWHVHMLAPVHYVQDCQNLLGCLVDHRLMSPEEIQERYQHSVKAWERFCNGEEPYDFVASFKFLTESGGCQHSEGALILTLSANL